MSKKTKEKQKSKYEEIALFRYGIISSVLYEGEEKQNEYFRKMAQKEYIVPHIGIKKYSISTFKAWLYKYRKYGFDGLKPAKRKDSNSSRKIPSEFTEIIYKILAESCVEKYSQLYRRLIKEGIIGQCDFSLQTLIKFLKNNNISLKEREITPRKKFEAEHINDLWMCDFMYSNSIRDGKKLKRTYLFSIIDDHSRMIVGSTWSFYENLFEVEKVLKSAILTHGLPKKLYCDNARVFRSEAIHLPCAKLGIALIHSKPYDSPSRGKIERFFSTVQTMFLPTIDRGKITLPELNSAFDEWLKNEYHRRVHQGIGETPLERFMKSMEKVTIKRIPEEALDLVFYRTIKRKVKQDCTVSVNGKLYEAPAKYMGTEIELRYSSSSPEEIFIFEDEKPLYKLRVLNVHQNANSPYVSISFSNLLRKENK
jgi:transposase InsO family protein